MRIPLTIAIAGALACVPASGARNAGDPEAAAKLTAMVNMLSPNRQLAIDGCRMTWTVVECAGNIRIEQTLSLGKISRIQDGPWGNLLMVSVPSRWTRKVEKVQTHCAQRLATDLENSGTSEEWSIELEEHEEAFDLFSALASACGAKPALVHLPYTEHD